MPLRLRVPGGGRLHVEIRYCPVCTHRFLPTTDEEQAAIEAKYEGAYAGYRTDRVFERAVRDEIERSIVPLTPPPGRVLDVGCGNGAFLRAMEERGYEAQGIDVSETGVTQCRERGLSVVCADFLTTEFDGRFDVVSMWDVVEHLRDPAAFVRKAWSLLSPGGVLVLKIPGFERLVFPLIRVDSRFAHVLLGAPGHVQYFNRRSLHALLRRVGIEDVRWPEPREMREKRTAGGLRNVALRAIARGVRRASGSHNLLTVSLKAPVPAAASLDPR